jgi:hypothetical protein
MNIKKGVIFLIFLLFGLACFYGGRIYQNKENIIELLAIKKDVFEYKRKYELSRERK